jgi:hypothetical protein
MSESKTRYAVVKQKKQPDLLYKDEGHGWRYINLRSRSGGWSIPGNVYGVPAEPPEGTLIHELEPGLWLTEVVRKLEAVGAL